MPRSTTYSIFIIKEVDILLNLKRTRDGINLHTLNDFDDNWKTIEKVINDRGVEILSDEAFLTWLYENGIKHREEVQSFSDLPSNDSLNTVRGVSDDNKIYIKKEDGWVPFQTIDISKINDVELKADNFGLSAINFGVTGSGESDDTSALQNLVDIAGEKAIQLRTDGIYVISDTIKLKNTTKIHGNNSTILLNANVHGILRPAGAIVTGLNIVSIFPGYDKIMMPLDDQSGFNVVNKGYVKDLTFSGDSEDLGYGMGAIDNGEHGVITYDEGDNLSFTRLKKGMFFENSHDKSWYNGNNYTNIRMYHCREFINLDGVCDGNSFKDVQIQSSGITETGIKCNGYNNKFDITSWDFGAYPDAVKYDFSGGFHNELNTNETEKNPNYFRGSITNKFNGGTVEGTVIPKINRESTSVYSRSNSPVNALVNYNGNQDDVLTMIDKTSTITRNGSVEDLSYLFRANRVSYTFEMTSGEEMEIKITPNEGHLYYIDIFGAVFTISKPDYVKFSYETSTGAYREILFENLQNVYAYTDEINGSSFSWVAVTFGVYTSKSVVMNRIFGSSRHMPPSTFLKTDGGDIYGDVALKEGRLTLNSPDGSLFRLNVSNNGDITAIKMPDGW